MASNYTETVTFEGRKLEVDMNVTWGHGGGFGLPEFSDPPEPPEFEIVAVWDGEGEAARLDDDEMARLDQHIAEHAEFEPPSYDDEW